jgi:hypothetical protein
MASFIASALSDGTPRRCIFTFFLHSGKLSYKKNEEKRDEYKYG